MHAPSVHRVAGPSMRCAPLGIPGGLAMPARKPSSAAPPSAPHATGLTGWWRADSLTITSGAVETWLAKTGSVTLGPQGTSGARPVVSAGACFGRDAVVYDFTNDFHASSVAISSLFAAGTKMIYAVARPTAYQTNIASPQYTNQQLVIDSGNYTGIVYRNASSGKAIAYNFDTTEDYAEVTIGDSGAPAFHLITYREVGGNIYIALDDGAWSAATPSGNTGMMTGTLNICGAGGWDVQVAEMFTYNVDTDGAAHTANLAYLAGYYTGIW